ncbi:Hypothetical Protein FCC1311_109222 [Hondaea fermentalgiana]|uniref:Uncharacterized protein n=1 Tax=Hondaea fermentalgiana TaxID=2315210 RepID=A0A2R5GV27_9STRA|nr:Hypothetical Protein FCC1311_109222 [Hondaea fermentalgiana]|eukprot:GBG34700.1 Hypothetical Protein FCC1311_109222 [Hondaea fermentalgiana]
MQLDKRPGRVASEDAESWSAREEFAAIRVFPSLVAARLSGGSVAAVAATTATSSKRTPTQTTPGAKASSSSLNAFGGTRATREIFLEDEQLRAARTAKLLESQKRRGAATKNKQGVAGFRPTTEVNCLADLREQIKRRTTKAKASRKKADQVRAAAFAHRQGTPFRPCNPHEARETLSAPQGRLAKNPYGRDITFPKDVREDSTPARCKPTPPAQRKSWVPASASARAALGTDSFLTAPDAESTLRDRARVESLRARMLVEFKDQLMVRNATDRTKSLVGYLARVEARMIRDQQARALEQARARAEATASRTVGFRRAQTSSSSAVTSTSVSYVKTPHVSER